MRRLESSFDATVASTMSSLMAVASASLIIPATLHAALGNGEKDREHELHDRILMLSHGTAVIMLVLYLLYLFFQLKTHTELFNDPGKNQAVNNGEDPESAVQQDEEQDQGRKDGDTLTPIPAGIALVIITLLVAICAEYLVDSINAVVEQTNMSRTFIGLILLPIVGNAAEHVTAVVVSWKGKMDLALGVAIGSSMQIALFVTPFLVLLGWAMNRDMTLNFEVFETVVFFLSVLVVNYLIQDGKSNYLEGCMCLGT